MACLMEFRKTSIDFVPKRCEKSCCLQFIVQVLVREPLTRFDLVEEDLEVRYQTRVLVRVAGFAESFSRFFASACEIESTTIRTGDCVDTLDCLENRLRDIAPELIHDIVRGWLIIEDKLSPKSAAATSLGNVVAQQGAVSAQNSRPPAPPEHLPEKSSQSPLRLLISLEARTVESDLWPNCRDLRPADFVRTGLCGSNLL
jgi:hypothetical protein